MAQWIMIIIAIGTIVYNTIITRAILKNDIKHLGIDVQAIKSRLDNLYDILVRNGLK